MNKIDKIKQTLELYNTLSKSKDYNNLDKIASLRGATLTTITRICNSQ